MTSGNISLVSLLILKLAINNINYKISYSSGNFIRCNDDQTLGELVLLVCCWQPMKSPIASVSSNKKPQVVDCATFLFVGELVAEE